MSSQNFTAIRGQALSYTGDPFLEGLEATMHHELDAMVIMSSGKIIHFGPASEVQSYVQEGVVVKNYGPDVIIMPGFIDSHVHYSQTQSIAASGDGFVDWLNNYIFIAEQQFVDKVHSSEVASVFLQECLRSGTTTAAVFCTVYPQSVDAFFEEAEVLNMRMIAGKILMDRNAPQALMDTPQQGYDESKALIEKWHKRGRLLYSVTPRFAPTSSHEQMEMAGALWQENSSTYLQSHISENQDEVVWAQSLYPERQGYLDIYAHYNLIGPRSIFGHGIWLTEKELQRCYETGTAIAHCPTSNSFLGSGLFNIEKAKKSERSVLVGLATDLGAGTSFSMLQTLSEAYKVARLNGNKFSAGHAFYMATRGAAQALYLDDKIGSLAPGMEADVIVLDLKSTPLIDYRMKYCKSFEESLFIQMTLGDERAILATYIAGELKYSRPEKF